MIEALLIFGFVATFVLGGTYYIAKFLDGEDE